MHHIDPFFRDGADSTMSISVKRRGGRTLAKVELSWAGQSVVGTGVSFRHPADCLTEEAGQKLAAARALSDLADRLQVSKGAHGDHAKRLHAAER